MPLILTIRNATELSNGSPTSLVLDRRGAMIGRAATTDWCLPDPALHISSRHCEIRFANERYELIDHSTNGTFLLGESARLAAPHAVNQGDVFLIGEYEIEASLDEASAAAIAAQRDAAANPANEWKGWGAAGGRADAPAQPPGPGASQWGPETAAPPPAPGGTGGWGQTPAPGAGSGGSGGWGPTPAAGGTPSSGSGSSGWGPAGATPAPSAPPPQPPPPAAGWGPSAEPAAQPPSSGWGASDNPAAPPPAAPVTPTGSGWGSGSTGAKDASGQSVNSPWNSAPREQAQAASGWSSAASKEIPSGSHDVWGKIAQSNVVDWARGGFGSAAPSPPPAPPRPSGSVASANFNPPPVAVPSAPEHATTQPPGPMPPPAAPPQAPEAGLRVLAQAAGVDPEKLAQGEEATLALAGDVLRRLVSGLVVMLEARARAKSQLGAQGTSLEFDGNNPLKFARSPEQALAQLLNAPERGFMPTERAIEDAFKDLQAHQMATLMAMQGALRATLDRFSPDAIRARAENKGMLAKVLPTARDAELWKVYEKEFSGVAKGSDEAFMDMFAKEFKRAYEEVARGR